MNSRHTDDMVNRISIQAAATFGREEYREVSSQILLHMSKEYDIELSAFRSEFFKKNIIIQRDADFLRQVLESRSGTKIAYSFLKYLSESDQDITCFADTIKAVGAQIPQKPHHYRERMIVEDLIQCVIQLFDRGKNDTKIIPMQKQNSSASGQQNPAGYMATNADRFPFAKERGCVRMATSFSKQKLPNDR